MDNNLMQNFNGFDKVANNLIDKISNGVGWVFTHETPQKKADNYFVKFIEESDYSPLDKCAMISNHKKILKEYKNQHFIVEQAIESLTNYSKPEMVEDDWISFFMDKAKNVSEESYQIIWGRLLAEECNEPGRVSKSLIITLEQMDRSDAEIFTDVCSCSVEFFTKSNSCFSPIIINPNSSFCNTKISFNSLIRLETLGLVKTEFNNVFLQVIDETPITARYYGHEYVFSPKIKKVPVGNVIFTDTGNILREIVNAKEIEGFFENICVPVFKDANNG